MLYVIRGCTLQKSALLAAVEKHEILQRGSMCAPGNGCACSSHCLPISSYRVVSLTPSLTQFSLLRIGCSLLHRHAFKWETSEHRLISLAWPCADHQLCSLLLVWNAVGIHWSSVLAQVGFTLFHRNRWACSLCRGQPNSLMCWTCSC